MLFTLITTALVILETLRYFLGNRPPLAMFQVFTDSIFPIIVFLAPDLANQFTPKTWMCFVILLIYVVVLEWFIYTLKKYLRWFGYLHDVEMDVRARDRDEIDKEGK